MRIYNIRMQDLKKVKTERLLSMTDKQLKSFLSGANRLANRKIKSTEKALEGLETVANKLVRRELGLGENTERLKPYRGTDRDRMISQVQRARGIAFNEVASAKGAVDVVRGYYGIAEYSQTINHDINEVYRIISTTSGWVDQAMSLGLSSSEGREGEEECSTHSEFVDWVFKRLKAKNAERSTM